MPVHKRNSSSTTSGRSVSNSRGNSNRSSIRVLPSSTSIPHSVQKTEPSHSNEVNSLPSRTLSPSDCSCLSSCSCTDDSTIRLTPSPSPKIVPSSSLQLYSSTTPSLTLPRTISSSHSTRQVTTNPPQELPRRWITSDRLNELRKRTHDAIRNHKVFSVRGNFTTIRKALLLRGYVEKLDLHRKAAMALNLTMDEMLHQLPNRQPGESRRQYISKCERNIISRFLEHTPVDFLWTFRKVKEITFGR